MRKEKLCSCASYSRFDMTFHATVFCVFSKRKVTIRPGFRETVPEKNIRAELILFPICPLFIFPIVFRLTDNVL
jgi:hypothetical protein